MLVGELPGMADEGAVEPHSEELAVQRREVCERFAVSPAPRRWARRAVASAARPSGWQRMLDTARWLRAHSSEARSDPASRITSLMSVEVSK